MITTTMIHDVRERYPDDMQLHAILDEYIRIEHKLAIMTASAKLLKGAVDEHASRW